MAYSAESSSIFDQFPAGAVLQGELGDIEELASKNPSDYVKLLSNYRIDVNYQTHTFRATPQSQNYYNPLSNTTAQTISGQTLSQTIQPGSMLSGFSGSVMWDNHPYIMQVPSFEQSINHATSEAYKCLKKLVEGKAKKPNKALKQAIKGLRTIPA